MRAYWILGLIMFLSFGVYKLLPQIKVIRLLLLLLLFALFLAAAYALRGPNVLGELQWYNTTPWREILLFIAMICGMVVNPIVQAIKHRRRKIEKLTKRGGSFQKPKLMLDIWDVILPLFFSLSTFGGLWAEMAGKVISPVTLAVAFETGFFWNNILKLR